MDVEFDDPALQRLEIDPPFTAGLDSGNVRAFRKRMQLIRAAIDERALRAMKCLQFESLSGDRHGQHAMRLNAPWRLIFRMLTREDGKRVAIVCSLESH